MLIPLMRARSQNNASMNLISIWAAISAVLYIFGSCGAAPSSAPLVKLSSYHIVKKPIHIVSDKFLSFTADPNTISHVAECDITNATLIMAKSLAPAYFRLAGFDSNRFLFQSNPNITANRTSKSKTFSMSNTEWLELNNFLSQTGMNVIASVSGQTGLNQEWDLSNTLELVTYSDKHNISLDWQLGYELQKTSSSGKQMGRDVTRLRKILDVFPRYRKSLIIGPDMTSFKTSNDAVFVRNYLTEAGDSLDVFTWHPFSRKSQDGEIVEMLANGMNSMDTYLWIKEGLAKSTSKGVVSKKSIWIAESENIQEASNTADSMTWIIRMGAAARLGASVYLRTPRLMSFYEPTPEYWTAILYKSLVGRTVLDVKQTSGNGTDKVYMFTHCTKFIYKPDESIINPEISYDPGSITVYGVNMASESTRISFKIGYKGDETAHIYVLTEDTTGDFPKTLLNRQPLGLSSDNELPMISPRIRESPKYFLIPGRSIFFLVFPNTKCRSCNEYDSPDASKSKAKITEEEDQDTNTFNNNVLEVMEDENDQDNIYVKYPKHIETSQITDSDSKTPFGIETDQSNLQRNTKFMTFTDETWMNTFPEKFKDVVNKEKEGAIDQKKSDMYRTLAQAMLGKRTGQIVKEVPKVENPTARFLIEDNLQSDQFKRAIKSPIRSKRGLELESAPMNETQLQDDSEEVDFSPEPKNAAEEEFDGKVDEKPEFQTEKVEQFDDKDDKKSKSELSSEEKDEELESEPNSPLPDDDTEKVLDNKDDFKKKIKRELPLKNVTIPEMTKNSTSSSNTSIIFTNEGTPSTDVLLNNIMDNVTELIQKFLININSKEPKQNLDLCDIMNTTRAKIGNMMDKTLMKKFTISDNFKEPNKSEHSTTRFVLEGDIQSVEFKEAVKNFEKFEKPSNVQPDKFNGDLDDFENDEAISDFVNSFKDISLYSFGPGKGTNSSYSFGQGNRTNSSYSFGQGNRTHSSETQKRAANPKIYAVPLDEENLQMALHNPQYREIIPIITFVKKPTLESMVEASKDRMKRETILEDSTSELTNNSAVFSTQSSINSTIKPNDEPVTQSSTSEIPPKEHKTIQDFSRGIVEEAGKLIEKLLQQEAENQSSTTPVENLKLANFSPELAKESDNSQVSRELREVDKPESIVSTHFKPIDKPNMRPVSPFPKKSKDAKSKLAKNTKSKSIDNVQLNHQDTSSISSTSTEAVVTSKQQIPQNVSSNLNKPSVLMVNPKSSYDTEDDLDEDTPTETKFQLAIAKNLQDITQAKPTLHNTPENVSLKVNLPSSKDIPTSQNEPESAHSETVGKPLKKPSLAGPIRKPLAKQTKTSPAKIKVDQMRRSNDQKRKELREKHLALLNEIRTLLGVPPLSNTHLNKRDANVIENWSEDSNIEQINWTDVRNRAIQRLQLAKELEKRSEERNDAEYPSSSLEIFKNNRPKRNSDIVVSPRISKDTPIEKQRAFIQARIEERRRQTVKLAEERKARKMKYPLDDIRSYNERYRRDLQEIIEKIKEHKEMKQTRSKNYSQKKAKRMEEIKQKLAHLPQTAHRNKRDVQTISEKIHSLKEQKQTRKEALRQKLTKHVEELKQKLSHHQPLIPHRSKRDLQKVQDKIHELRKKKQDHRQELHKESKPEQPIEQSITPAPAKLKPKAEKIDESSHQLDQKTKPEKIDEVHHQVNQKTKPEKIDEVHHQVNQKTKPEKIDEVHHQTNQKTKLEKMDELHHQINQKPKSNKIDKPHHRVDKSSKKSHKSSPIDETPHRVHKREENENQIEEKITTPFNLQSFFKFRIFADPELNTPQSVMEDSKFDEVDRLKRSINDNEIFDEDYETAAKIKNKDYDYKISKLNKIDLSHETSTSTMNPLLNTKTGDSVVKLYASQDIPSQENQTCQLTNYNLFKYFRCVAHRLWYNYFGI